MVSPGQCIVRHGSSTFLSCRSRKKAWVYFAGFYRCTHALWAQFPFVTTSIHLWGSWLLIAVQPWSWIKAKAPDLCRESAWGLIDPECEPHWEIAQSNTTVCICNAHTVLGIPRCGGSINIGEKTKALDPDRPEFICSKQLDIGVSYSRTLVALVTSFINWDMIPTSFLC